MDVTAPELKEILAAAALLHQDKEAGRTRLLALWDELSPKGDRQQMCALAHILADTEDEAAAELEWDLRSLEAATGGRDGEDRDAIAPASPSFLPSIHLSVAEGYRRVGDLERARRHTTVASDRIGILPEDAYGNLIRGGLRRMHLLLKSAAPSSRPPAGGPRSAGWPS